MTGWKTVIFGGLLALFGFLQGLNWVDVIPNNPELVGWITTGVGVVVIVLRTLTNSPIFSKSQ